MKKIRLLIYYSLPPFLSSLSFSLFLFPHAEAKQHIQKSARTTFVRDLKRELGKTTKIEHARDNRFITDSRSRQPSLPQGAGLA